MRKLVIFSVLVLAGAMVFAVIPSEEDKGVYSQVVRLHVVADSDSEYDQTVKLGVRDAILGYVMGLVRDCTDAGSAAEVIAHDLPSIRKCAQSAVDTFGSCDACTVVLSDEYYPTRDYDGVSLPAGVYKSLRVNIGSAQGQNWWCVLYPTLCTFAARAGSVLKQTGFTPEQIGLLTDNDKPVYVIKFKILELLHDGFFRSTRTDSPRALPQS